MANSKIVWVGQTAGLRIDQIQPATEGHISKYVFYSAYTGLTGVGELTAASTTVNAHDPVNSEKKYPITSYLLYSHKFANSTTTFATSNKVVTYLTVQQPLDETSLRAVSLTDTHEVWSNKTSETFHITPTFSDQYGPYNKACILKSDSTDASAAWGSIQNYETEALNDGSEFGWTKTTSKSTDLKKESHNITINIQSRAGISAATTRTIDGRHVTVLVKNAVTELKALTNKTLYAGSTAVSADVTITPDKPYSKELVLVKGNTDVSGNSITSAGGAKVSLSGQTITFDASAVKIGTDTQTITFKVRSRQGAFAVDTDEITFIVNRVDNITKTIVEGETISVSPGIGAIQTATITSGNTAIRISKSTETISITGLGVDNDTNWSIDVINTAGAKITISGKTTHLTDVSTSINTGDYIIIGTDFIGGLGASISKIATTPAAGKASITTDGKLKYEASTANGPINPDTYAIKVEGANGATRTVQITVSNITAELS